MHNYFQYLLNQKTDKRTPPEINEDTLDICQQFIVDKNYFDFISFIGNGGFFFGQSLQVYDLGENKNFNNILSVNTTLVENFGDIFKDLFAFAQDIFGNQFVYDQKRDAFAFFCAESGERQSMGNTFSEWLDVFVADRDYYTGQSYEQQWKLQHDLPFDHRIMPKIPFIIGGDFEVSNFYTSAYPKYHSFNADFAKQIINLPDGQKIKLVIKNTH